MSCACTAGARTDFFERTANVTLLTEFAKAAVVHIIDIVAADAGTVCRDLAWHGFVVAGLAGQSFVPTIKPE